MKKIGCDCSINQEVFGKNFINVSQAQSRKNSQLLLFQSLKFEDQTNHPGHFSISQLV
jgi:hypothetical protein